MAGAKMELEDWLDDLCVRFIINLPQADLSTIPRICFQVEEAQWFYEDFIRPLDPELPSLPLRDFCLRIFKHCPLLTSFPIDAHIQAFDEFIAYKERIPVRGAILLNAEMDSVVLVKGWRKGASWSFPRGKINKDEDDLDCAIREVYEETGLDVREAGFVPDDEEITYIDVTMRDQQMRLYIFRGIPMTTNFAPRTRKEISKIEWYKLSELPAFRKRGQQNQHDNANNAKNANRFYMVAPFLVPLKKWVLKQKKLDARVKQYLAAEPVPEETATEDDIWIPKVESQSQMAAGRVPDQGVMDGATRELQRLLNINPPTHGIQASAQPEEPAQASRSDRPESQQDKGGALMALLQSKVAMHPAEDQPRQTELPHTPQELIVSEPQQPQPPHHHAAHHSPLANQSRQPPHFSVPGGAYTAHGHAGMGDNFAAYQPRPVNGYDTLHKAPPLIHPQPLPPQVQKTTVFNYTTPPPGAVSRTQEVQPLRMLHANRLMQHAQQAHYSQNLQYAEYTHNTQPAPGVGPLQNGPHESSSQDRSHDAPLSDHSKSLLNALKSGPSENEVAKPMYGYAQASAGDHAAPPVPPHRSRDVAAASQPYEPTGRPTPSGQSFLDESVIRNHGPVDERHRSALLDIFRTDTEPSRGMSVGPRRDSGLDSPMTHDQQDGQHPHGGPAVQQPFIVLKRGTIEQSPTGPPLAVAPAPPSVSPRAIRSTAPSARPSGDHTLLRLLRKADGREAQDKAVVPSMLGPYRDNPESVPSSLASPPSASKLPLPVSILQRRADAPPEHKQKLLSLFGKPQAGGAEDAGEVSGKGKEVYRMGSAGSGSKNTPSTSEVHSRRGSQTPISPADRSFLLGYLQSAGKQGAY